MTPRNPFSAARFAPGALPWIGELDAYVDRVCIPGARLQILGPHGSGKTTMLAHLARQASRRGWVACAFRGSQGLSDLELDAQGRRPLVVFADEAEELGTSRLLLLRAVCALRSASLVVTAHRDLGFETLCERAVDAATVERLVEHLLEGTMAPPTTEAIEDLLHRHRGNVREIFFDLYDRIGCRA